MKYSITTNLKASPIEAQISRINRISNKVALPAAIPNMKTFFLSSSHRALRYLFILALTLCLYLPVVSNAADLNFDVSSKFDYGVGGSVAINANRFFVEFHTSESAFSSDIWYRFGKIDGTSVSWGRSQYSGFSGYWPTVAISREGYILVVFSTKVNKSGSELQYRVGGMINPNEDVNQAIVWRTGSLFWDRGFHASISMNDNGTIVGVHETHGSSKRLYYRVGTFINPAANDFNIAWSSGASGIGYDDGWNPHISINNKNQVVQVHQVPGEFLTHYRRGIVTGGKIDFSESVRYNNSAEQPAVALLDNGRVLEVYSYFGLYSRTGNLSLSNSKDIQWSAPVQVHGDSDAWYPALAANGVYAIAIDARPRQYTLRTELYYSVADL
jgi:hypothetical protein